MTIARASLLLLCDRAAQSASFFATGVLLARTQGAASYGQYVVAGAVLGLVVASAGAGGEASFMRRYLAAAPDERGAVLKAYRRALTVIAALAACALLAVATSPLGGGHDLPVLLALAGLGVFQLPTLVSEWALRADGAAQRVALTRVATVGLALVLKLIAVLLGAPTWVVFLVTVLESALVGLVLAVAQPSLRGWRGPPLAHARASYAEGLRIAAAALCVVGFFRVNQLMLASRAGFEAAGHYGAALTLVTAFDLVSGSIAAAAYPHLLRQGCTPDNCLPSLQRLGRLYALGSIGFVALALVAGAPLLAALYGPAYRDAHAALVVLACSTLFTSSAAVRTLYINLLGRAQLHLANALAGLAVLVPASWWLSVEFGALGAAIALTLACAVSGVAASFAFAATRRIGRVQLRSFVPLPLRWGRDAPH